MKSDRNRPLLALALTLALLLTQAAPAYAAESTTQADAVGSIAADYDADEGEVHNTINADSLLPEADPADGMATFASYSYETELAKFPKSYQVLLAKLHKSTPTGSLSPTRPTWTLPPRWTKRPTTPCPTSAPAPAAFS